MLTLVLGATTNDDNDGDSGDEDDNERRDEGHDKEATINDEDTVYIMTSTCGARSGES